MSTPAGRPVESVRVDEDRPSWLPWLIGLLLVTLLALVLFLVLGDDEDEEDVDVAADPAVTQLDAPDVDTDVDVDADADAGATPETTAGATPGAGASAPADGPFVLTVPFDGVAEQQRGTQVTGSRLSVVDVPADEAFTVGTAEDELLVFLTPAARTGAESNADVQPGSTVASLEGALEPITDEFLRERQITEQEAEGLREKGFYVAATAFELAP